MLDAAGLHGCRAVRRARPGCQAPRHPVCAEPWPTLLAAMSSANMASQASTTASCTLCPLLPPCAAMSLASLDRRLAASNRLTAVGRLEHTQLAQPEGLCMPAAPPAIRPCLDRPWRLNRVVQAAEYRQGPAGDTSIACQLEHGGCSWWWWCAGAPMILTHCSRLGGATSA